MVDSSGHKKKDGVTLVSAAALLRGANGIAGPYVIFTGSPLPSQACIAMPVIRVSASISSRDDGGQDEDTALARSCIQISLDSG